MKLLVIALILALVPDVHAQGKFERQLRRYERDLKKAEVTERAKIYQDVSRLNVDLEPKAAKRLTLVLAKGLEDESRYVRLRALQGLLRAPDVDRAIEALVEGFEEQLDEVPGVHRRMTAAIKHFNKHRDLGDIIDATEKDVLGRLYYFDLYLRGIAQIPDPRIEGAIVKALDCDLDETPSRMAASLVEAALTLGTRQSVGAACDLLVASGHRLTAGEHPRYVRSSRGIVTVLDMLSAQLNGLFREAHNKLIERFEEWAEASGVPSPEGLRWSREGEDWFARVESELPELGETVEGPLEVQLPLPKASEVLRYLQED